MKKVFADTNYWVAITNPRDNLHALALEARKKAGSVVIVTTDEVMVEYLNFFSKQSEQIRAATLKSIKTIRSNPNIVVAPQTDLPHVWWTRRASGLTSAGRDFQHEAPHIYR